MWYTMITFQFLFADFFSSVKLKIVFLCNFSGSSSKPLPELKTSFIYSQMYKVSYTLLVLPENLSLVLPCPAPAWTVCTPSCDQFSAQDFPPSSSGDSFPAWSPPDLQGFFILGYVLILSGHRLVLAFWEIVLGRTILETLHSQMTSVLPSCFILGQDMGV